jgi:hypothetical protein
MKVKVGAERKRDISWITRGSPPANGRRTGQDIVASGRVGRKLLLSEGIPLPS